MDIEKVLNIIDLDGELPESGPPVPPILLSWSLESPRGMDIVPKSKKAVTLDESGWAVMPAFNFEDDEDVSAPEDLESVSAAHPFASAVSLVSSDDFMNHPLLVAASSEQPLSAAHQGISKGAKLVKAKCKLAAKATAVAKKEAASTKAAAKAACKATKSSGCTKSAEKDKG